MNTIRTLAVSLSLLVHATLGYAMLPQRLDVNVDALEAGSGDDVVTVEQGIAIEGLAKLGEALETIETVDVAPAETTPPVEDVKPIDELRDVVTSDASKVEEKIVKTEEPPPDVKERPPEDGRAQEQRPEQVAIVSEQSSGEERSGGDPKAFSLYLGKINEMVQRAKVNPRSRIAGTVVMKFTVGTDGGLIAKEVASSSGHSALDNAAITALERAAPFPPIPPEVSTGPLAFTQPFRFITR